MSKFYTSVEQKGNNILYRGYENGIPVEKKVGYRPHLFVPSTEKTEYVSFSSKRNLKKKEFETISEFKEYIQSYSNVDNFQIYGCSDIRRQYLGNTFEGEIAWDYNLIKIWFYDIETKAEFGFPKPDDANQEVLLINMLDQKTKKMYIWSTFTIFEDSEIFKREGTDLERFEIDFMSFDTEKEMLQDFLIFFSTTRIDALAGWNSEIFDMPYLVNRMKIVLGENFPSILSPWKSILPKTIQINEVETANTYRILGVPHLDMLSLYQKFNPGSQESWKLDYIAYVELGKRKVELPGDAFKDTYKGTYECTSEEESKASKFHAASYQRYLVTQALEKSDADETLQVDLKELNALCEKLALGKFVQYNGIDVSLLYDLEAHMSLIKLAFQLAYMTKSDVNDVTSSMRLWESTIYNYFLERGIIEDLTKTKNTRKHIIGGYVKEPIPKKYGWIISLDATSKYPSIIMQNNISPETIVGMEDYFIDDILAGKHLSRVADGNILSANGLVTTQDFVGFIPVLIKRTFDLRKATKNKMLALKAEQELVKEQLKQLGVDVDSIS